MAKKIDVLIAGSANDAFFSRIAFARLSLDALEGDYRAARVVAVLAEYDTPEIPARWAPYFANIDVIWANPDGLPNPGWNLQHYKRSEVMRDDADVAILLDADVCALRPFDDLLETIVRDQVLAGVIAHYHFPIDKARGDPEEDWTRIAQAVLGHDIERPHRYLFGRAPGAGGGPIADPEQRPRAPFYLNYGVVMGPPALVRRMLEGEKALQPAISRITGDVWAAQVGLALVCAEQSLPTLALPVRYNYANRPETDALYPEELDEIVLFHYMFDRNLKRDTLFTERKAFQAFVDTRHDGADERLRRHIVKITGGRYPFPPPRPEAAPKAAGAPHWKDLESGDIANRFKTLGQEIRKNGLIDSGRLPYEICLGHGVRQAIHCGYDRVAAVELGVAQGRGLLSLCRAAEFYSREFGIGIDVYGFDNAAGMPAPQGYRDHPEIWREGQFRMQDPEAIRDALADFGRLIIGDVADTLADFSLRIAGTPLCFASFDLKHYGSTSSAMQILQMEAGRYVPAMPVFFNNVKGLVSYNSRCGEELAIREFNERHDMRLLEEKSGYQLHNFYILQVLDHPLRTGAAQPRLPFIIRGY